MFFSRFRVRLSVFAAAFLSFSLPRACMADLLPPPPMPPMVTRLPGEFIEFFMELFFSVIPVIIAGFFAMWLFLRYRRHYRAGLKAVLETFIDIFCLCILIFCAMVLVGAVSSSYDRGYASSSGLILLLILSLSILAGARRYKTDTFAGMCPNFRAVARQFYVTSFLLLAGLSMFVLFLPYWDGSDIDFPIDFFWRPLWVFPVPRFF
jgi:hypothetical protein